jgi:hypothetical protein
MGLKKTPKSITMTCLASNMYLDCALSCDLSRILIGLYNKPKKKQKKTKKLANIYVELDKAKWNYELMCP